MRALRRFFARLLHSAAVGSDERLREEMESHVANQFEENLRTGMNPEEARRLAHVKFGTMGAVRDDCRAEKRLPFFDTLSADLRYAFRVLRRSPAFTAVTALTLMLGIGANLVVFGVLNAVLLTPLDVSHPEELYQLRHKAWMSWRLLTTSYPAFEDFRQRNVTFRGMAGVYGYSHAAVRWGHMALSVSGDEVSGNFFDLLGVQPQAGRFFHAGDENGPDSAPYVVLSDDLWRRAFQGDRSIVGQTVDLNRHPFTVVGIAAPTFHGAERFARPDYWIPMANQQQLETRDYLHNRTAITVTVIGRLKPGVTPEQATENLNAISAQLGREHPDTDDGQPLRLVRAGLYGDEGEVIRGFLVGVTALSLLVLAAACANLATLFAARASDRNRELALRVALGSTRRRLLRQLLTEAAMVSLMGGAAGLVSAKALLGLVNRWNSPYGQLDVRVDARIYLAGLGLTLGSAVLFGLLPARQAWQSQPMRMIRNEPSDGMNFRRLALRDVLLGLQIAICTLLVTASLVAVRGIGNALRVPLGFEPRGAMLADPDLSQTEDAGGVGLEKEKAMIEAARHIPGVTAAGTINRTPMTGGIHGIPVFRPGTSDFRIGNSALAAYVYEISPGYLEAAGTRLPRGRDVSWHDTPSTPFVAIVNAAFARRMWRGEEAMGQHFIVSGNLTEVVGIAEDGKYHDLQEPPQAAVYLPLSQSAQSEMVFVLRSGRRPGEIAAALQHALSPIEPNVPITVQDWSEALDSQLFPERAATIALGVMGLLAAMLAVTGIFGMAAYSVSRRTKELGIRTALGARRTQVIRAALGRPILLLGAGSALGLTMGVLAGGLLQRIVYQADPGNPAVLAGTVGTMALLGAAASAIPAVRALALDPSRLMRED